MRYFLDTEFDGKGGPLISLALVREDGKSLYCVNELAPRDAWVKQHVCPVVLAAEVPAILCPTNHMGGVIADFLRHDEAPVIIADWPDDIAHLCQELTARSLYWGDPDGQLQGMPPLRFEVSDVDAYPTNLSGAVQHNAWWDAMALRAKYWESAKPEVAVVDARLFAAAPELLEALKDAVESLEQTLRWRGEGWECSEDELLGAARAAIAKASPPVQQALSRRNGGDSRLCSTPIDPPLDGAKGG